MMAIAAIKKKTNFRYRKQTFILRQLLVSGECAVGREEWSGHQLTAH